MARVNKSLVFAGAVMVALLTFAQSSAVPAYHPNPPKKGEVLPPIMTEHQLAQQGLNQPVQLRAYVAAAKVQDVLHQLPCYCYCDRSQGHKSLRTCFEGTHGANCGTCMQEALYAYEQTMKKKTVAQIREGIMKGEFKNVDLQAANR